MNEENTRKARLGKSKGRINKEKVLSMTEKEIMADAQSDPDAQPTDEKFWENAVWVYYGDSGNKKFSLAKDIVEWMESNNLEPHSYINSLLHKQMQNPPRA